MFREILQNTQQFQIFTVFIRKYDLFKHIAFELLALECGAPPGGRGKTGRKAAVAQRPTPCEAEGRASYGAKHLKAKCSNFGPKNRRPQNYVGRRPKMGGVPDDNIKPRTFDVEAVELRLWVEKAI